MMEEAKEIMLYITMKSGRRYTFYTSTVVLDWLFDRMFGRETGNFQNIEDKVMACAVNMDIVKKESWSSYILKDNDTIELLNFVGGG